MRYLGESFVMHDPLTRRGFVGAVALSPLAGGGAERSPEPTSGLRRDQDDGDGPTLRLPACYYQQFDADWTREIPAEGYGGWKSAEVELARDHTAAVVMHAWDCGRREDYPGWYRAVEYIPRANAICARVFPPLLGAAREHGLRLLHVVGGGDYYKRCPGYRMARELAGESPPPLEQVKADPHLDRLRRFRAENVFVGARNAQDVRAGSARIDFAPQARPRDDEGVAEDSHQLFALCKHFGVNHLIYAGFAINWCLLMSPGGMLEMSRRGVMCSALRQAVTAVENKETARQELAKELGLWRVALAFGLVFNVDDLISALARPAEQRPRESRR
jgi:hypothetical protein